MTVQSDVLISSSRVPSAAANSYTSTGRKTIVDIYTVTNTSGAGATFSAWVVPASGTPDDTNKIIDVQTVASHECLPIEGLIGRRLNAGESIYTEASIADVLTHRAEGRGVT